MWSSSFASSPSSLCSLGDLLRLKLLDLVSLDDPPLPPPVPSSIFAARRARLPLRLDNDADDEIDARFARFSSPLSFDAAVSGGDGKPDDAGLLGRSGRSGSVDGLPRKMAELGRCVRVADADDGRGVVIGGCRAFRAVVVDYFMSFVSSTTATAKGER